jgi:hypothetical protein
VHRTSPDLTPFHPEKEPHQLRVTPTELPHGLAIEQSHSSPYPDRTKSPLDYTIEKIEPRLRYVQKHASQRSLTPRPQIFLALYQYAAEQALESAEPDPEGSS